MRTVIVGALVTSLTACATQPTPTHQSSAVSTASASSSHFDPNQVICESEEVTGSHIATERQCKTRAQWSEEQRQTRQDVQQRSSIIPTGGPH